MVNSQYNLAFKQWLENMDLDKNQLFPLTSNMCAKNHFYYLSEKMTVSKLVSQGVKEPVAIMIYKEIRPGTIHVYSIEVRSDFRYKGVGRRMIQGLCEKNDTVELSSLPESKIFYEKCGFRPVEENKFVWERGKGWQQGENDEIKAE